MMITGWRCPEYLSISVALRDSVPFVQFKKREKHLWRSVTLKLVSATFYQIFLFFPNDSPTKTLENVFYFI